MGWGGVLSRIHVGPGQSEDRFVRVRRQVHDLLPGTADEWAARPPEERPRLFGGFAFLRETGGDPSWSGFPSAAFVLPRVMLESRPQGLRLVIHQTAEEAGGGTAELEREMDRDLDRLEGLLTRDPGGGARHPVPPGETPLLERLAAVVPDTPDDARARWAEAVDAVLGEVAEGRVRKAVLSRILDARFPREVAPLEALRFLRDENRRAHVFLLELAPGRVFLGAAPEILAEFRGGRFEATAVAGSVSRGSDEGRDEALAKELLASEKDRNEHRLTAEEMIEVLEPRLEDMEVEEEPRVLRLARIQHLETIIRGRAAPGEDVLSLVEALHPTPAVCGRPRHAALELIRAAEPFDRGWYAGPVGWVDPAGDGDFVPALRSAVGSGVRWRLFAGAGIVEGSDPEAEWDETALKFEPALRALGFASIRPALRPGRSGPFAAGPG